MQIYNSNVSFFTYCSKNGFEFPAWGIKQWGSAAAWKSAGWGEAQTHMPSRRVIVHWMLTLANYKPPTSHLFLRVISQGPVCIPGRSWEMREICHRSACAVEALVLGEPLSIQVCAQNVWAALKWSNGVKVWHASRPRGQPRSSSDKKQEGKTHTWSLRGLSFPFAECCYRFSAAGERRGRFLSCLHNRSEIFLTHLNRWELSALDHMAFCWWEQKYKCDSERRYHQKKEQL